LKTGFIILCRYNSSRLPGKILKEINGRPVISYIVERLSTAVSRDAIVVATSDQPTDDPIEAYCKQQALSCFRGSLDDVASRFFHCAKHHQMDFAFRINGDNIFVDIDLVKEAVALAETQQYDFISNVHNRTFPKGMSIEGVNVALYGRSLPFFNEYHREHVMPYFYEHADEISHHYIYNNKAPELAGIQLAIDTQQDYELATRIINEFPPTNTTFGLKEISTILKHYDKQFQG
jgi:spore coat polysaccharide biosynthesis protein SpsF